MSFVVDASVAIAWCIDDEATPDTEAVLDRLRADGATVPAIWPLEVANALLTAERRQRLPQIQVVGRLQLLARLPIAVVRTPLIEAWGTVLTLAREQRLSAYDASYLELALRLRLPLASQDERLQAAATRVGVPLVTTIS